MGAHTVRPEIGGLPGALATKHVCVGHADRVVCRLFPGLLVPFMGHAAIVADTHTPPGSKVVPG